MVSFLPPTLSTTFLFAAVAPLVIGFLVGIIAKAALKLGLAVAILLGLLIGLGMVAPDQVLAPIVSMVASGQAYVEKMRQIAGYLPYSTITFVLGLALGFLKG